MSSTGGTSQGPTGTSFFSKLERVAERVGLPIPAQISRAVAGKLHTVTLNVHAASNLRKASLLGNDPYVVVSLESVSPPAAQVAVLPPQQPLNSRVQAQPPAPPSTSLTMATNNMKMSPVVPRGGASPALNFIFTFPCDPSSQVLHVVLKHKTLQKAGMCTYVPHNTHAYRYIYEVDVIFSALYVHVCIYAIAMGMQESLLL